jgi:hypothetical protein
MPVPIEDAIADNIIGYDGAASVVNMKAKRPIIIDAVAIEQAVPASPIHGITPIGIGTP